MARFMDRRWIGAMSIERILEVVVASIAVALLFSLRPNQPGNCSVESRMLMNLSFSSIARPVVMGAALTAGMVLAGCAAETGWPKLSDFSNITQKVLSPQEQEQAVQSMAAEQKAEQAKAIAKIEKNK